MICKMKRRADAKNRLTLIAFCAILGTLTLAMVSRVPPASAAPPSTPKTIPVHGHPVNLLWRGHAYPGIVGSAMIEAGWVFGDQMDTASSYYMLMWQDGPAARWYVWIYDGGWEAEWGYWSYGSATHYYFDPNPFHWGWYLDDLEGAEDKVYNTWTSTSLPWSMQYDSYWWGNSGTYNGEYNDGYAQRFTISESTTGEGATQWTTNPTFKVGDPSNKWDLVNYCFDWGIGRGASWAVDNDATHYATWPSDRLVKISAYDEVPLIDTIAESARVTYGPFNIQQHTYPYTEPYRLTVSGLDRLTIKGVVSKYETFPPALTAATGIKFDAWFSDPANGGRALVIEMYFLRAGFNFIWGDESFRTLAGGTIDDHLFNVWAFPTLVNEVGHSMLQQNPDRETGTATFIIDLKSIWLRAQNHFGRSNQDQLYAVALDLESVADGFSAQVWAETSEIKVTYTDSNAPSNPNSWTGSHFPYVWSADNTIDISWAGASDAGSGVYGYSIDWTTSSSTLPDTTVDTTGTSATSPPLSSSNSWYFHVRTRDNAGNWAPNAYHVGPFYIDTTAPSNPTGWSGSHSRWVWSSDNTIDITWSGAYDAHSGVYGYSFVWDTSPTTIPDATVDTTGTSTTSPALASGSSWYFHVRTRDNVGNWNSGAFHVGPFYIDTVAPSNPTGWSGSHSLYVWSSDNTIYISWSGASDAHSGVYGYSFVWDTSPTTIPDTTVDTTGTSTTSSALATGSSWYFHVRARDNVGNWASGAYHVGPFYIDTQAPSNPTAWSSSHTVGIWSMDNTIDMSWTGASDAHSGVYGYSFVWDTSLSTIPDAVADTTGTSTTSPALASGSSWYFHVRTVDNVGNGASGALHVGPFYIDTTAPSNPTTSSSSHTPNVWSSDNTIDISWSGASDAHSGVYGYSFVWDTSPTTVPDTTVDTTGTSTTSPALASGNSWYFHVRTRDNAGNWNSGAFHIGPFCIDTIAPSTPSLLYPWNNYNITDAKPTFTWKPATDSHSEVQSYTLQLDTSTSFNSGNLRTYTGITSTSYEIPTGLLRTTWYWRTQAVDNAGNVGAYQSYRTTRIDKIGTQLSVSVNPSSIKLRQTTTISGYLIPATEIIIESTAINDPNTRYHGLTIDETLSATFWIDQPSAVIGSSAGDFYYVTQVYLPAGAHYVTYGVNADVGKWHVRIYINGVLAGEADTDVNTHYTVGFNTSGLGSKTISLSYSKDGGAWTSITNVTTGSNGYYSYVWKPPKKGSYVVRATFGGDSDYSGSSATANLTVG